MPPSSLPIPSPIPGPPTGGRHHGWYLPDLRGALLGVLALPWVVHASVVLLSAVGARPLSGRATSTVILLAALAVAVLLGSRAGSSARSAARNASVALVGAPGALALALSAAGATALASSVVIAVVVPLAAYDALGYRLPVIAQWLDAGRVAWVDSDDVVRNGYPLGQEAVSAVVAAATGSLRLAGVTSSLFVAGGALALWLLGEECGVRRPLARAMAGVLVLVPMVILNAPSGYVDAAFAGAVVALLCTTALLVTGRASDPWLGATAGMAAAHVLSLKGNGIAFVAVTAIAAFAASVKQRPPVLPFLVAAIVAVPGAFWAVRNVVHTGNPLWPVEVKLAGHTVLPGVASMSALLDVAHNTPAELAPLSGALRVLRTWLQLGGPASGFDERLGGLGWAWPAIAVPAIVLFVVRAIRAKADRARLAVAFVLVVTAALFAVQPMSWWPRYTIWVWGAGALAIGVGAERLAEDGRLALVGAGLGALALLTIGEGGFALVQASRAPSAAVAPDFWRLGFADETDVCRGAWKPGTDDANLDGVFAQLAPRPRVHVLSDDDGAWPRVRQAWQDAGCSKLLLFQGSPVLTLASGDPEVSVEPSTAFDPLFVVRPKKPPIAHRSDREP